MASMPGADFDECLEEGLALIYIAAWLGEAKRVESILTAKEIRYKVALESYLVPAPVLFFFTSRRVGVFFFVSPAQADLAHSLLSAAGLNEGLLDHERA